LAACQVLRAMDCFPPWHWMLIECTPPSDYYISAHLCYRFADVQFSSDVADVQCIHRPNSIKNCSCECSYNCAQPWYTIQHRTVLVIIIAQTMTIGRESEKYEKQYSNIALTTAWSHTQMHKRIDSGPAYLYYHSECYRQCQWRYMSEITHREQFGTSLIQNTCK